MKKIIISAFMIVILGSSGLFGQTVKTTRGVLNFSGKVSTGVYFDSDNVSLLDTSGVGIAGNIKYYGKDGYFRQWTTTDFRTFSENSFQVYLAARYETGNMGLFMGLMVLDGNMYSNARFFPYDCYGYLRLFNRSLIMRAGYMVGKPTFSAGADSRAIMFTEGYNLDGPGLQLEFESWRIPAIGKIFTKANLGQLTLGTFIILPSSANPDPVYDANWKQVPNAGALTFKNVMNETAFAIRWTHPWFQFRATYKMDGYADNSSLKYRGNDKLWSSADTDTRTYFGLWLTRLEDLTLYGGGMMTGLGHWEARGRGWLFQQIEYRLVRLPVPYLSNTFVGIKGREKIYGFDMKKSTGWDIELSPWVQVRPYIGYRAGNGISASLEFGAAFGHNNIWRSSTEPKNVTAWYTGDTLSTTASPSLFLVYEKMNFHVKPGIIWDVPNTGLTVDAWYMFCNIQYGDLAGDPIFANRANQPLPVKADRSGPVDSITKHQVALQFSWRF